MLIAPAVVKSAAVSSSSERRAFDGSEKKRKIEFAESSVAGVMTPTFSLRSHPASCGLLMTRGVASRLVIAVALRLTTAMLQVLLSVQLRGTDYRHQMRTTRFSSR